MAWLDGWDNRLELTIDHERIGEDLSDFPIFITLGSGIGRNNFDAGIVFDELTTISGILFQDDFTAGGSQWYDVTGTADFGSGYLRHGSDGERARTSNNIEYGRDWEMTFKFIQYGTSTTADQLRVNPVYSVVGGTDIQIYMRTYSVSSHELTFYVEGSSRGGVTTYNWYNQAGNWISVRLKKIGNDIYFRVWVPPDPEPAVWNITTTCTEAFATSAQFDFQTTYTNATGAGLDDVLIYGNVYENKKIAVTDYTGINQLPVEIEYWDLYTRRASLWTKVPTVSSGTDTVVYLYYDSTHLDNNLWVGDTGTAPALEVWDDNYSGV